MAVNRVDVSGCPVSVRRKYSATGVPAMDRFINGMIGIRRRPGEVEESVDEAGKAQIGNTLTVDGASGTSGTIRSIPAYPVIP